MKIQKIVVVAICCSLVSVQANEASYVFDFEDTSGTSTMWTPGFTAVSSNLTLTGVGRLSSVNWPDGHDREAEGSYGFLYGAGANPGDDNRLSVVDNGSGEGQWFVLESIDLTSGSVSNLSTVTGLLEGEAQWVITVTDGEAVSNSPTSYIYPTYTNGHPSVAGDLLDSVDELLWVSYGGGWGEQVDNVVLRPVPKIATKEVIYRWNWDGFWTPHALFEWNLTVKGMNLLNFDQYWWCGDDTSNSTSIIKHRPGMANLPDSGGFGGAEYDVNVGGFGNRGIYVDNEIRSLITNEVLSVTCDWKMFVNGSDDGRFVDMFFSTVGDTGAKRFGQSGTELGFAWYQTANSNDVAITFDASDDWMSVTPPVLRVPLTDLGIDVGTGDHEGDNLAITYTAKKTTVENTWFCSLIISNKDTQASFSVEDVAIQNSAIYNNPTYFCIYTPDDLSDGDLTSGANTAGYEIDDLQVVLFKNQPPEPEGYAAYLADNLLTDEPNTGEFEDYDNDGMLNIYEYALGGDLMDPGVQGQHPELINNGGVITFSILELSDPLRGITYEIKQTSDLVNQAWQDVQSWSSTTVLPHNELYDEVRRAVDLSGSDLFFKTVITTNAP